ncbi:MAG: glutathione S-transferase family protein [Lentisphaeraceae bacterium]|nr:glutathione S-transferase family protein [Lentisphaeraceae bacterium]
MKPILYGIGISPYVRKVRFILTFKDIEYDLDPIIPGKAPEGFSEKSPINKIPALSVGDFSISDSSVISQYIERKFDHQHVLPKDAEGLAKTLWFEEYADSRMTEILGGIFFNKFAKPKVFGMDPDLKVVKSLEARVPELMNYLEKQLIGKDYLVNDTITLADMAVVSILQNYLIAGYEIDGATWPNLARYHTAIVQHPAVSIVLEQEAKELAEML